MFCNKVTINLQKIKYIVSCVLPDEFKENPLDTSLDKKKDKFLKRARKDFCELILKEMNDIISVDELIKASIKLDIGKINFFLVFLKVFIKELKI